MSLHIGKAGLSLFPLALALSLSAQDRPRVLVDLSHEFTFRYDIFGLDRYWTGPTAIDKTSSFASLTQPILLQHDVLVVSQSYTYVPFSDSELAMIESWVSGGGGLWIAGNRIAYLGANPGQSYPLANLSARFGASFSSSRRSGDYQVRPHALTIGVTGLRIDEGDPNNTLLLSAPEWQPLITDSVGQPVIAVRVFGQGHVMVSAQDAIISNPFQRPDIGNIALVQNIVRWLAGPATADRSRPVPGRVHPEKRVVVGSVEFLYPTTIEGVPGVEFLRNQTARILSALETSVHGVALVQSLRVLALAGAGGGYSGGAEIGIAAHSAPEPMLLVIAHELTHSFDVTGGQHPEWMHGWPSLAAMRVARLAQYGGNYQKVADEEYQSRVAAFRDYEIRNGANSLDITEVDRGVFTNAWAIGGKLMTLIEMLERAYGSDFMTRMYRIKRRYSGVMPHQTDGMIHWLSLAAGEDLFEFFRRTGARVPRTIPTLPVVVQTNPPTADPRTWLPITPPDWTGAVPLSVEFNTRLDSTTATSSAAQIFGNRLGRREARVALLNPTTLTLEASPPLLPCEGTTVVLQPLLRDRLENPVDRNGDGVSDGSADAFQWSFNVAARPPEVRSAQNNTWPAGGGTGRLSITTGCAWSAATDADWILLTVTRSATGGDIVYHVLSNSGAPRSGRIIVDGQTITVTQGSATTRVAGPLIRGIAHGASYSGLVSPSTWVAIFGDRLVGSSSTARTWREDEIINGQLARSLEGVSVRVNDEPTAIYYVSPGQIVFLAPDLTIAGQVVVEVSTPEGKALGKTSFGSLSPGLFIGPRRGESLFVAAVHGAPDSSGAPIYVGYPDLLPGVLARVPVPGDSIALYGSGFGPTTPPTHAGVTVVPSALSNSIRVTVAGVEAPVDYAGLVGPGLVQINIRVPVLPPGDHEVVVELVSLRTQAGLLLPVAVGSP